MIGLLTKKLIDFFRQTDIVIENHIPVLTSNVSDGRTVVNTTLPAIVVTVDSAPNNMVYIGGLIRDNINIDIVVMDRLVNYTLSGETDIYQWRRNLAYKLRTELFTERASEFFKDILQGNNFLPMYRGMNNFIKQGYKEDTEEDIECWRMKFECVMVDNSTIDITYIKAKSGSVQLIDKQINPVTPIHPHYGIEEMMWKYGYGQYIPDLLDMIVKSGQITDQYKVEGSGNIPSSISENVLFLPENFPAKTSYQNLYGILSMKYVPYNDNMTSFNNGVEIRELNVDTSSWITLNNAFRNCYFLTKINEGNIVDCSGIIEGKILRYAFYGCSCIEEINFINMPDFAVSVDSMFSLAPNIIPDKLKKISFSPKLNALNVTLLFNGRGSLEEIIGELDFSKITSANVQNNPFHGCTSLVEIRFTKESIKYNLSFTQSSQLSDESIQSILDGLATVSSTQTLALNSAVYAKLTEEQKQSATDKGWTITG
jgi:hypothetical protein